MESAKTQKAMKPTTSLNLVVFQEALQPLCKTHMQSSDLKKNKDLVVQNLQVLFRKETEYLQSELKIMRESLQEALKTEQVVRNYDSAFEVEVANLKAEIFELNELVRTKDIQLQAASSEVAGLQKSRIAQRQKEIGEWQRAAAARSTPSSTGSRSSRATWARAPCARSSDLCAVSQAVPPVARLLWQLELLSPIVSCIVSSGSIHVTRMPPNNSSSCEHSCCCTARA